MRMPAALSRLSARERRLLFLVAGAVFVVLNLLAIRGLLRSITDLQAQWSNRRMTATASRALVSQSELWSRRETWLQEKQPAIGAGRESEPACRAPA